VFTEYKHNYESQSRRNKKNVSIDQEIGGILKSNSKDVDLMEII
jgi:hypothetical protein